MAAASEERTGDVRERVLAWPSMPVCGAAGAISGRPTGSVKDPVIGPGASMLWCETEGLRGTEERTGVANRDGAPFAVGDIESRSLGSCCGEPFFCCHGWLAWPAAGTPRTTRMFRVAGTRSWPLGCGLLVSAARTPVGMFADAMGAEKNLAALDGGGCVASGGGDCTRSAAIVIFLIQEKNWLQRKATLCVQFSRVNAPSVDHRLAALR